MENIQKYFVILIVGIVFYLTACTSGFESDNTNKAAITKEQQELDNKLYQVPLHVLQVGVYLQYSGIGRDWPWQVTQNLTSDIYSGYLHAGKNGDWYAQTPSYGYNDYWNLSYQYAYQYIAPSILQSMKINVVYPNFLCITKILKVLLLHRMVDLYGPVLYTNYGINDTPDSVEKAYKAMIDDLDDAIIKLDQYIVENPGLNIFTQDILTTDKSYESWLKFANSLRLRLAMRLSFIDKTYTQGIVNKAIAYGKFLEIGASEYIATRSEAYNNPLAAVVSWNDIMINANMEVYMVGYNDPRNTKYFTKALDAKDEDIVAPAKFAVNGTIKGIPQGVGVKDSRYALYSDPIVTTKTPAYLMTAAEVWFLRSEAALRGFTSENAEECYMKGVQASFDQCGAGDATSYLASEASPIEYKDQFDEAFDNKLETKITPKWGGSKEENFERIAVQKWIAVFPEGGEAWAEVRRMGYPELLKLKVDFSDNIDAKKGERIRRLYYPRAYIKEGQPELYKKLVTELNGVDNDATRLWWDVENKEL